MNGYFKIDDTNTETLEGYNINRNEWWWSRKYEYPWVYSQIEEEEIVVDAGCGIEHPFKYILAEKSKKVYAVDKDEKILQIETPSGIHNVCTDIVSMPIQDEEIDTVYCISVLEHMKFEEVKKALLEFKRVLRGGGRVILTIDIVYDSTKSPHFSWITWIEQFTCCIPEGIYIDGEHEVHKEHVLKHERYNLCVYHMVLRKEAKVLIAAPIRQTKEVFEKYLESLDKLVIPDWIKTNRFFLFHNCDLYKHYKGFDYEVWNSDTKYKNHNWGYLAYAEMVLMRNRIAEKTLEYDYLFSVDSDLILHENTLLQLLSRNKDIISNIFWTQWKEGEEVLPNAWNCDQYSFFKGEVEKWKNPGCYKVGMTGACILIKQKVYESGIRYDQIPNLTLIGEDRWFCVKAVVHGFNIWIDTTYPAKHLYR